MNANANTELGNDRAPQLYNLRDDPGERRNVAAAYPAKVQQLEPGTDARARAGFVDRGGKGSHRNFLHPSGVRITLSSRPGDDAKPYQEQEVAQRIAAARSAKGDQT